MLRKVPRAVSGSGCPFFTHFFVASLTIRAAVWFTLSPVDMLGERSPCELRITLPTAFLHGSLGPAPHFGHGRSIKNCMDQGYAFPIEKVLQLFRMDVLDEINLRMKVTNLEARLALLEIKSDALTREIKSRLTSVERRNEVRESLDAAWGERVNLITELERIRRSHPDIRH